MVIILSLSTGMLMAQTWTSLSGPSTPRNIKDIAISDSGTTGYAADQTYLFKTTNSGTSWAITGDAISAPLVITCKPNNPSYAVVGAASMLKYTTNGGSNWYPVSCQNLPATYIPLSLMNSPVSSSNNLYAGIQYVSGYKSIYYSTDGGQHFAAPNSFYNSDVNDIASHPTTGDKVYICGSDPANVAEGTTDNNRGMWYSTDHGQTWYVVNQTSVYDVEKIGVKNGATYDTLYMYTKTNKMFVSMTGGNAWTQKTVPQNATNITDIRVRTDNDSVYVTADNGIFLSSDHCSTWTLQQSGSYAALAKGTTNQSTLYAGTANALYVTTNSGSTWTEKDDGLGRMPVTSIAANGSSCWAVSSSSGVVGYYNGSAWSNTLVDQAFTGQNVLYHPSGDIMVTGIYNQKPGLFRKASGGSTYSQIVVNSGSTASSSNLFKGVINDPSTTTRLYVWGEDNGYSNFYVIENYTAQPLSIITTIIGPTYTNKVNDVVIDASSVNGSGMAQILYAGLDNVGVYKTSGPGTGWYCVTTNYNVGTVYSLALNSSSSTLADTLWAVSSTGIWRTVNEGSTWVNMSASSSYTRLILRPGYPNDASHIAVTTTGSIWYTDNATTSWVSGTGDLPSTINNLKPVTGSSPLVYGATDMGAYKLAVPAAAPTLSSPANGATNQALNVTASWSSTDASSYQYIIDDNSDFSSPLVNTKVSTASYQNSGLATVTTYYWKVSGINLVGQGPFQSTANSFTTIPSITLTVGRGELVGNATAARSPFISAANRASGPQIDNLGPPKAYYVRLDWTANGTLGACSIYRCVDGGSFCQIDTVASGIYTYSDESATMYASGNHGSILTYYVVGSGAQSNNASIQVKDIWMEKKSGLIPQVTELLQNYPNPFNPTTTLDYQLASPGFVRMVIYNSLGQEVTTLVDEKKDIGYYTAKWDAGNAASGLYFARVSISDNNGKSLYQDVKKLVLVK
jgi:photosystem II stability/assembly factor-like uncharacterized protein